MPEWPSKTAHGAAKVYNGGELKLQSVWHNVWASCFSYFVLCYKVYCTEYIWYVPVSWEEGVYKILKLFLGDTASLQDPLFVHHLLQHGVLQRLPHHCQDVCAPPSIKDDKETVARPGPNARGFQLHRAVCLSFNTYVITREKVNLW